MRGMPTLCLLVLGISLGGCGLRPHGKPGGVAPKGLYVFSGVIDGEVVNGTLEFGDPVLLDSTHGRCVRQIHGLRRWGGPFGVTCPGFSVRVRVENDGRLQKVAVARLMKTGQREQRAGCLSWSQDRRRCLVWNYVTVQHDYWVEGTVRVEPSSD